MLFNRLISHQSGKNLLQNYGRRHFSSSSSKIDFNNLGFNYVETDSMIVYTYDAENGWDKGVKQGPMLQIHALSNVLHYGQAIFEGLKCFEKKDGTISAFNPKANAERLQNGAARLGMPEVPTEIFLEAIERVVQDNIDFVPPYESGASFYLRPFLFGHGAQLGLGAAPKYSFAIAAAPVGNYYQGGKLKPVESLIIDYHRAAPRGVGNVKCAGNYAADVMPAKSASEKGFPIALYLDAAEDKYIEEFSTSNFIGITKDKKKYVTPKSESILPSITNKMLMKIAQDQLGMDVEVRKIPFDEVNTFSEVGACGTAVIVSPIKSITRSLGTSDESTVSFDEEFPVLQQLYQTLRDIQTGDGEDKYGWHYEIAKR